MLDFNFYNPTRAIFGKGKASEIDNYVPKNSKTLVIYDKITKELGILKDVTSSLEKSQRELFFFDEIEPNPQFKTLMNAVEIIRKNNIDFIIAVGGGSVIDGTKFVALVAKNEYYKGKEDQVLKLDTDVTGLEPGIPFGAVTTMPATASEMNPHAVISNGNDKLGISNKFNFAKFAILDPQYTYTLPKNQVANGIADSMIHALEQYITYPVDARFQDRTTEGIVQTLIEVAPAILSDDDNRNYEARSNWMWCATMAMNTLIGSGVPQDFASHMIGHELTALFKIAHGASLVIVMPALWRVCKKQKLLKLAQYAERVWGITDGSNEQKADLAIEKTENFFRSMGMKTRLSEYDITESQLEEVIAKLEEHGMTALSENQDITLDVSREILKSAM